MALWRFELNEDEDLVIDQKPHWSMLMVPVVQVVLILAVTVLGIIYLSFLPSWTLLFPLALCAVLSGRLAFRTAKYKASRLIVSNERLIYVSGVLGRRAQEIPIPQISNLSFNQKLSNRILGYGSVEVDHSGEHGKAIFQYVRRPERIVRLVTSQISRRSSVRGVTKAYSPIDELTKLAHLMQAGSITQDEYESAKSRLLDQI
ncbi:MAG: hypothetical protein EPN30_09415 [Actinomycetota bacterium]|nr:MAG: hypothetical protein EPN30_09415 [Actinomycetota bacterium]